MSGAASGCVVLHVSVVLVCMSCEYVVPVRAVIVLCVCCVCAVWVLCVCCDCVVCAPRVCTVGVCCTCVSVCARCFRIAHLKFAKTAKCKMQRNFGVLSWRSLQQPDTHQALLTLRICTHCVQCVHVCAVYCARAVVCVRCSVCVHVRCALCCCDQCAVCTRVL